ncbi:MAG: hypothetical protein GYA17_02615 [Chloroflexi bacterium]|nr:hypothetical protein [Chloroflexota bacterium]
MHLTHERILSYRDGALDDTQRIQVENHLETCTACRERLTQASRRAGRVSSLLAHLDPGPAETTRTAASAYRSFQQKEIPTMKLKPSFRPAWALLTLVLVLAVALSFQPVRVLAGNFLSLFRVEQVTVLPVDMSSLERLGKDPSLGEAAGQLFSDSVTVTREKSDPVTVGSLDEAAQLAGFTPRSWANAPVTPQISVESGSASTFTIDRQRAQSLIDEIHNGDILLPEELDGVRVSVDVPSAVVQTYNCAEPVQTDSLDDDDRWSSPDCLALMQVPSPVIQTEPDIDPVQLAEISFEILGMSQDEAANMAQSVDWATTLVIPVPRNEVSYEKVSVDGVEANLIRPVNNGEHVPEYILVWIKDGLVTAVMGSGDAGPGIELANQLQ